MKKYLILILFPVLNLSCIFVNSKLDKIFKAEEIKIAHLSIGCFHHRHTTYIISNKSDDIIVNSIFPNQYGVKDNKSVQFHLSKIELLELKNIFKEGVRLPKNGTCTTFERFIITSGKTTVYFEITDCNFDKFDDWVSKYDKYNE
jgi:hypothetical protein